MVVELGKTLSQFFETQPREIGLVNDSWGVRFDPLTISRSVCGFVLVCNMVVVLSNISQAGQSNLQKAEHTSTCSGVNCL